MKNPMIQIAIAAMLLITACKKDTPTPDNNGGGSSSTPQAPTNVTAYPDDKKDSITWSSVFEPTNYVTKYNVYAGTQAGYKGTLVGTVQTSNASTFSFVHTGLTNGTTYYYYVTAVNSIGEGAKSTEVSATPTIPLSKTTTMLIQQYLPAVVQAAPYRYYDANDAEYGQNKFAKTDTFKLFFSSKIVAGHDTTIFQTNGTGFVNFKPETQILADLKEKPIGWYASNPGINNTFSQVALWLWSGDNTFKVNAYNPQLWDTIPMNVKVSGLSSLSAIKSVWVRGSTTGWFQDRTSTYKAMYEKELSISDFTLVEGWAKLDKSKPTIYHVGSDYYFVTPYKNTQGQYFNAEIVIRYKDGSEASQMMAFYKSW